MGGAPPELMLIELGAQVAYTPTAAGLRTSRPEHLDLMPWAPTSS